MLKVTISGQQGEGKTTLANLLIKWAEENSKDYLLVEEDEGISSSLSSRGGSIDLLIVTEQR